MRPPVKSDNRRNLMVLGALLMAGAAYGIWVGVYEPLRRQRDEVKKQADALEAELQTIRLQIRQMPETKRELAGLTRNLRDHSEDHLLHPRLGNYLLQAREDMAHYARMAGVEGVQVEEIGLIDLPLLPKKTADYRLRAYAIRVSAQCGLDSLLDWIRVIETGNPLVSVSHLTISAQPENPLQHRVRLEVQWPVWIEPDMRDTVREKAEEILGDGVT